jgi:glycosyltransferase involved in cell wall biosynthesis
MISLAAFVCRQAGVPYVLSPRGMLQAMATRRKQALKWIYFWLCEQRTIAGARALHFFSDAELQDSQRFVNGTTRTVVVPSGVDPSLACNVERGQFRKAWPALRGKRIALFLGRLHWSKGLELQTQALALLAKEFRDLVWVLIGPDEGAYDGLSRQIREMGLGGQVVWTGLLPWQTSLEALVDADVLLLTSRHEAHSMAMNEALAIGVPVIVTDTVQFDEVQQWGAGYVVPSDPQHLAAAVADILCHPEKADRMREAGRQMVAKRLAWPKVAEAMVRVYEEILVDHVPDRQGYDVS